MKTFFLCLFAFTLSAAQAESKVIQARCEVFVNDPNGSVYKSLIVDLLPTSDGFAGKGEKPITDALTILLELKYSVSNEALSSPQLSVAIVQIIDGQPTVRGSAVGVITGGATVRAYFQFNDLVKMALEKTGSIDVRKAIEDKAIANQPYFTGVVCQPKI